MNRVMREAGPMSDAAPAYPTAGGALAPLKAKAEAAGLDDFSSLWSGQAAGLATEMGAGELTRQLAKDSLQLLARLGAAQQT
jgi:nitronate monooxygenase